MSDIGIGAAIIIQQAKADAVTLALPNKLTNAPQPTGSPRSLNTPFQISADYPSLAIYTIKLEVQAPLLSTQSIAVTLSHDAANPPTTEDGVLYLCGEQLAGLGLVSIATKTQQQIVAWIPPGDYVELSTSGAGTATLTGATELVFSG